MKLKFICECGHDKFEFAMYELLIHKSGFRKTLPSHINWNMWQTNMCNLEFRARCSKCSKIWWGLSLAELQKGMIESGVLK